MSSIGSSSGDGSSVIVSSTGEPSDSNHDSEIAVFSLDRPIVKSVLDKEVGDEVEFYMAPYIRIYKITGLEKATL